MSDYLGPVVDTIVKKVDVWISCGFTTAAAALIWLPSIGPIDLEPLRAAFGVWLAVAFVAGVGLTVGRTLQIIDRAVRARRRRAAREAAERMHEAKQNAEREAREAKVLGALDGLSAPELRLLGQMLLDGRRTIAGTVYQTDISMLRAKGLIVQPLDGGEYGPMAIPFTVPDFVWRALCTDRERFTALVEQERVQKNARLRP